MGERRSSDRHKAFFPVAMDSSTRKDRIAMSRNASSSGVLIGSPSKFEVGERLTMTFRILPAGPMYAGIVGRVVRVEESKNDEDPMWRHIMAVEFESPLSEEIVEALHTASDHSVHFE